VTVEQLVPDLPPSAHEKPDAGGFVRALDVLGDMLTGAARAEDDFAYGNGTLQAAVYERAQADVALSAATASASRLAQAVQSVLNMQV
jgi:flagellar hook-basal body complex protein FliE